MQIQNKVFTLEKSSKSAWFTKFHVSFEILLGTMIRFS